MRRTIKTEKKPIIPLKAPPVRKSLGQHVFENLKQAIMSGDFSPDERIVESSIAGALNISRTPVREAIHKLEREGFLKKLPRGGFVVLALSPREVEETFGIRSILESYAARLAAINHPANDLNPLEKKINEFKKCLDLKEIDELPRINTEFHDLLYQLSGSSKLTKMIGDLRDQIYCFRQMILKNEDLARISNRDHRMMLKKIRKGDAKGVEELVKAHILRGQAAVLEGFNKHNKRQ